MHGDIQDCWAPRLCMTSLPYMDAVVEYETPAGQLCMKPRKQCTAWMYASNMPSSKARQNWPSPLVSRIYTHMHIATRWWIQFCRCYITGWANNMHGNRYTYSYSGYHVRSYSVRKNLYYIPCSTVSTFIDMLTILLNLINNLQRFYLWE